MSNMNDLMQIINSPEIAEAIKKRGEEIDIALKIKEKRLELGWTQSELASKMGVAQNVISRIESLEGGISSRTIAKFCRATGLELSFKTKIATMSNNNDIYTINNKQLKFKYLSDADNSVKDVWGLVSRNYITFGYCCPKTLKEVDLWVGENNTSPIFVAYFSNEDDQSDIFAGFIYISNYNNFKVEIGYMVHEDYRRVRIATAMIKYIENYCKTYLNIENIIAHVYNSEASSSLLLKNGYTYCGTVPNWEKVYIDETTTILNKKTFYKNLTFTI
jgi:transcriptional regulator with XRE-family HTH domain/GNAT superfamily N-acetyltransferase